MSLYPPDPWRALQLPRDASLEEVKAAYRRLAKRYHPDSAGESALPRFLAIQAAYESLTEAIRLLNQAIERDPAFALAHYQLAYAHDLIYFVGTDHTPARLAMADAVIQTLSHLRPNSGEAHLALATHSYFGYLDYDRARQEVDLAQKSLPNDPLPFQFAGFIDRRQGRWTESTKNLEGHRVRPTKSFLAPTASQKLCVFAALRRCRAGL